MITVTRRTDAPPDAVWAVIADGWSYPAWVVGASRIRAVSATWPQAGAMIHHSVGAWPLLLDDNTEVLDVEAGRFLRLKARGRPYGEAVVEIEIKPDGTGSRIEMREDASNGPARLLPKPLRQAALAPRNAESLKRLTLLAEAHPFPDGDAEA
jgi:uncharacterized protein YndB with AHSA1/START domain